MRYTPEAGTQDITLYTSGLVESDQIRYIDYNELMEDRFEVCGIGMVEDPGSCDPDGNQDFDIDADTDADADADADADNGWDRSSEVDIKSEESSSGCSTARNRGDALGLGLILGLTALCRRRRSGS